MDDRGKGDFLETIFSDALLWRKRIHIEKRKKYQKQIWMRKENPIYSCRT